MRRLRLRGLTANWRLKLAALAAAVLIWAMVSAEQITSQWITVPVQPDLRDPDLVLTGNPDPDEVRVLFVGPGRELWELVLERPRLVLPIRGAGNRRTFAVDPGMVRLPTGLAVRAQDVRPGVVFLEMERRATRMVPVRPQLGSRSLQQYVVGEELRVEPAVVRVSGPAERVRRIRAVLTRPFEISGDSTFTREVALDTAGVGDATLSPLRVRVSGTLQPRAERAIPGVALQVPAGLQAQPATVEVRVQGAAALLATIDPASLRAVVSPDSLPEALPPQGLEAAVSIEGLPPGAEARSTPLRVRVLPAGAAASRDSAPGAPR